MPITHTTRRQAKMESLINQEFTPPMEPITPKEGASDEVRLLIKMHAIMSELSNISKDKTNAFHKYSYASEEAIKRAVHPLLVTHGVLFSMNIGTINVEGEKVLVSTEYSFTDVETGFSKAGTFVGSGQDSGDKAVYKAITGAIKYIMTTTFLIPTGDDVEGDSATDKSAAVKSYAQPAPSSPGGAASRAGAMPSAPDGIHTFMVEDVFSSTTKAGDPYKALSTEIGKIMAWKETESQVFKGVTYTGDIRKGSLVRLVSDDEEPLPELGF